MRVLKNMNISELNLLHKINTEGEFDFNEISKMDLRNFVTPDSLLMYLLCMIQNNCFTPEKLHQCEELLKENSTKFANTLLRVASSVTDTHMGIAFDLVKLVATYDKYLNLKTLLTYFNLPTLMTFVKQDELLTQFFIKYIAEEYIKNDPYLLKQLSENADCVELIKKAGAETGNRLSTYLNSDPAKKLKMNQLASQFQNNYNEINYDGLLLSCAQTAANKKYSFQPTVVDTYEFGRYLRDYIGAKSFPLRERFIIEACHRRAGDIWIDEHGKMSVIIIDSLGSGSSYAIDVLNMFPDATVYINRDCYQNDNISCAVFAFDALLNLHTQENYLSANYKNHPAPMHAYAKHSAEQINRLSTYDNSRVVHYFELPLRMLLNMQSRQIFDTISDKKDEKDITVNKKNETPKVAVDKHFVTDFTNMKKNQRIQNKLKNLSSKNISYMLDTPNFQSEMRLFSFTAKKKALESKKTAEVTPETSSKHKIT